jgi:hypothetical protein
MNLTELAFQCVDAIRAADYPHETQGPDTMLDCIDMDAAYAIQMLDAYEKEHDEALALVDRLTASVGELEAEVGRLEAHRDSYEAMFRTASERLSNVQRALDGKFDATPEVAP